MLFDDLSDNTGAHSFAAFTDGKTVVVVHSDWGEKFHLEGDGVARHDNFLVCWELYLTGNIGGTEVELWLVTL